MDGPMDPSSEPISFSLNNNQEVVTSAPHSPPITQGGVDVADSIKASIYESLKNDLLMGKTPPMLSVANSTPSISGTTRTTCPTTQPETVQAQTTARKHKKLDSPGRIPPLPTSGHSPVSSNHSPPGQDVLRLLGAGQLPISVGNSAITITKTPRVSLSGPSTHPQMSFPVSVSSTPVSLSLTRAGTSQVFSLGSLGGGVVLSSHPPQGSVVLQGMPSQTNNVVLSNHQPSECVLLSPNMGTAGQGLVLQGQPGVGGVVLSGHHQPGQVVLAPATGQPLLIAGLSGGKLILTPSPQHSPVSHRPAPSPTSTSVTIDTVPVTLSITKPTHPNPASPTSHSPAPGKRPAPPLDS